MFKKSLLIAILLLVHHFSFSQSPSKNAFSTGEMLRYKGSYFMSSLWADIAEVKMEVSDFNAGGKSLYTIQATASTYSNYDSFFKIRDLYQTWIDKNDLKPYIFKRVVDEGGYKFDMKYIIQRTSMQAKYEYQRKGNIKTSTIPITENTQDLVSVLYYLRSLDIESMPVNKVIKAPTLIDDKVQDIILTYKGKETLKTELFGSKQCYKFGISINNKALVSKETNNIWLTADQSKIPVQIRAEIPVGSIQLRLVEANGIKK